MKCHKQFIIFRCSRPSALILLGAYSLHVGLCVLLLLGKLCLPVILKEDWLVALSHLRVAFSGITSRWQYVVVLSAQFLNGTKLHWCIFT